MMIQYENSLGRRATKRLAPQNLFNLNSIMRYNEHKEDNQSGAPHPEEHINEGTGPRVPQKDYVND